MAVKDGGQAGDAKSLVGFHCLVMAATTGHIYKAVLEQPDNGRHFI